MLEREVIVFTITLLSNKRLSAQNDMQVKGIKRNDKDRRSHKEVLYWFDQTTCLCPVSNKLVEIL